MAIQFGVNSTIPGQLVVGVTIAPGQQYLIRYITNTWSMNPRFGFYDANGSNRKAAGFYLLPASKDPRATEGCLVAMVGNPVRAKYYLGNFGFIGAIGLAGDIYLSINDAWNNPINRTFWNDNQGSITVEVIEYTEYLRNLIDPGEMENFLTLYGSTVGITTVAGLQAAIASNDVLLFTAILNPNVVLGSGENI